MSNILERAHPFLIIADKNLHLGSGVESISAIDKLVQRDPITQFPIVHASSIKGALREFFEYKKYGEIYNVFGSASDEQNKREGSYHFFNAELLFYPVRSNSRPFFLATCHESLKSFKKNLVEYCGTDNNNSLIKSINNLLEFEVDDNKPVVIFKTKNHHKDIIIEDFKAENIIYSEEYRALFSLIKKSSIVLFSYNDFKNLVGENCLPVVARNYLENGESKNIWYEEFVPANCVFFTMIAGSNNYSEIENILSENIIIIGANASIGYGCCKFKSF